MAARNGTRLVPYDLDAEVIEGENDLPIVVSIAMRYALLRKELKGLENILVHLAEVSVRDRDLLPPEGDEYGDQSDDDVETTRQGFMSPFDLDPEASE